MLEVITEAGLEGPIAGDETGTSAPASIPRSRSSGAAPQAAGCRRLQGECIVQWHLADLAWIDVKSTVRSCPVV